MAWANNPTWVASAWACCSSNSFPVRNMYKSTLRFFLYVQWPLESAYPNICVHTHKCMHINRHAHTCMCTYRRTYCLYVHKYIYIHYNYKSIRIGIYTYIHRYINTYIRTYMHIYTYEYIRSSVPKINKYIVHAYNIHTHISTYKQKCIFIPEIDTLMNKYKYKYIYIW